MSTDEKQYHPVARASEIVPGMGKLVEAAGAEIAVFHFAGAFYAVSNRCPHRGASLADGFLEAGKVFCPWHCFDFNLKTGACEMVPSLQVQPYEVKVEGDEVFVLC
jgi:nitrite reductase (NADH) small subunit